MEPRRMPSNSSLAHEHSSHRRDLPPPHTRQDLERSDHGPSRPAPPLQSPVTDGPTVNPARAALINQADHARNEPMRNDRESRRERVPRPQSPHVGEDRRGDDRRIEDRPPPVYHGRSEMPRDLHEERGPLAANSIGRDRRDEPASTPTGPRSGRIEPPLPASNPRETFQEMFQPPRPPRSSAQDPNYGRLNQPADPTPPSGPRSAYNTPKTDVQPVTRSGERHPQSQSQPPTPTPPSGPAASLPPGIHPSRLDNIQRVPPGPALQTNMPNAPSGPRGSGRGPQNTMPSPVGRGPPTGPAAAERGSRGRNPLGAINSVLTQNAPNTENRTSERPPTGQNPPVRGRGAARANGPMEVTGGTSSPMPPPSHALTPNSRAEGQHARGNRGDVPPNRMEGTPQDDGRLDSRGHRDSRRSERSGRDRSHSADRSERRPDERPSRTGPPRVEGEERGPDRERGGREKRGSERDGSSRRDREREGERPGREPRESRESGRRERGSRDEGRSSGREDRRSRGGGTADDGRKRTRELQDQGQGHGDVKRRR
jgi:THO complex subunit 2